MARLWRGRARSGQQRRADDADLAHLVAFAEQHAGVEAFVEPQTAVTSTTAVATPSFDTTTVITVS